MKNTLYLVLFMFSISACAPNMYRNLSNPDAVWEEDSFACNRYAEGATPMPQLQQTESSKTTSGYATVYHSDGTSTMAHYTHTTTPDPLQQASVNLNNASKELAYQVARTTRYEECLRSKGWSKYDPAAESKKAQQQFKTSSDCFAAEAKKQVEFSNDFEAITTKVYNICTSTVGEGERRMAAYYTRQALDAKQGK